jgi:hypothetical protein
MRLARIARIALIVVACSSVCRGDDAERRRELAGDLLDALDMKTTMATSMEMTRTMMAAQIQQMQKAAPGGAALNPAARALQEKVMDRTMKLVAEELTWDKMRDSFVEVYAETFTAEEMEGLTAFFRTSVGRAYVAKQPELMQRTAAVTQRVTAGLVPKLIALQAEIMREERGGAKPPAAKALPEKQPAPAGEK